MMISIVKQVERSISPSPSKNDLKSPKAISTIKINVDKIKSNNDLHADLR